MCFKKRKYLIRLFLSTSVLLANLSNAQIHTVKFEQLDSLQKSEKRPILVFLHTSWCKYCGAMKNTTFKNKEVESLLNQKFYFVSLDIEEESPIFFRGHTFKNKPNGVNTGVHELAEQFGTINGQIAYPGVCFLNAEYEIIHQQEGFVPAKKFLQIANSLINVLWY